MLDASLRQLPSDGFSLGVWPMNPSDQRGLLTRIRFQVIFFGSFFGLKLSAVNRRLCKHKFCSKRFHRRFAYRLHIFQNNLFGYFQFTAKSLWHQSFLWQTSGCHNPMVGVPVFRDDLTLAQDRFLSVAAIWPLLPVFCTDGNFFAQYLCTSLSTL